MRGWQGGDLVGGGEDIKLSERAYYWRDDVGTWHPVPTESEQPERTDQEITDFVRRGLLVRYPKWIRDMPIAELDEDQTLLWEGDQA